MRRYSGRTGKRGNSAALRPPILRRFAHFAKIGLQPKRGVAVAAERLNPARHGIRKVRECALSDLFLLPNFLHFRNLLYNCAGNRASSDGSPPKAGIDMGDKRVILVSEEQKLILASATAEMLARVLPKIIVEMTRGGQIILHVKPDFTEVEIEPQPERILVRVGVAAPTSTQ